MPHEVETIACILRNHVVAVAVGFSACCGCLSQQVANDGRGVRDAVIELYTDEAVDNLIRAHEGQPFVQLSYSNLTINDEDKLILSVTGGDTTFGLTNSKDLTKAAPLNGVQKAKSFVGKFPSVVLRNATRLLTLTRAAPVTNQNWIYEDYLAFASDPGLFCSSDVAPPCPVHISRKCGSTWYWIPAEAGEKFLELVLKTATVSNPNAPPPPMGYWETTIKSYVIQPAPEGASQDYFAYTLTVATPVPNDLGSAQVIRSNGSKDWVVVTLPPTTGPIQQTTPTLVVHSKEKLTQLTGATIRFFAINQPNLQPQATTGPSVQNSLENIRIQLNKIGNNGS